MLYILYAAVKQNLMRVAEDDILWRYSKGEQSIKYQVIKKCTITLDVMLPEPETDI